MSHRSNRLKPSNRLKTSAKLALAVAGTTIAALIVLLFIFFNLSKQENSFGQSLMVFESADVLQDTSSVFRGSINQAILGVEVKTSGNKNPVKLANITFSASGTSLPVIKNIENARLWFTGNDNNFNTSVQIGQTLPQITENNFDIIVNRQLNPGKNYFWLTCDIKADAAAKNGTIDAQCISLRIGTNTFIPMLSSPAGKKKIFSNTPYFSTGHSGFNQPDMWNSKRDGSGREPDKQDDLNNCYFIQSGHNLTNTSETILGSVIIEKHGCLKAKQPLNANYLLVTDGGIYQQEFSIKEGNPVKNFKMDNGANYIHLNDGKLPGVKKYFSPHSNQCFYQYSAETFSEKVVCGNVLINSAQGSTLDISNAFKNIQGDLELHKTGMNNFLFVGKTDTLNIGGSLIFSGGTFVASGLSNTSVVINIGEDLIMKS
ncbi:MAG TPA: BNR-repeat neuraminidase N-terminal domain-containing protein, partial [Bacteroidia bacterium]|nr:BNR-repeat neuraminidase N-terminal domain-containing protein [Bacteroidia bacterium]